MFFRFLQSGDINPSLTDPALLAVVGVVDGQVTGFIMKERKNFIFSHSQSHPCGPGTCVGNKGSGWPGHWFDCTAG